MLVEGKSVEELRELNRRRMLRVHDIPEYCVWQEMKQRCTNNFSTGLPFLPLSVM
jgi:hypothetical protein